MGKTELSLQRPTGSRPVCLGGRPVCVQRFSRPPLNVLVVYLHYVGISLGQLVCKFLRRLNLGYGGEGGIRTPGRGFSPYNGLANRRIQPLCHLSAACFQQVTTLPAIIWWPNGGLTGDKCGKPPSGELLAAAKSSPNFNSSCWRSACALFISSIPLCTFSTASSRVRSKTLI